jgi:hypothetical protein
LIASEIVGSGESAVVIFTRGGHFVLHEDGSAVTGNWVISRSRRIDKVIIYKQDQIGNQHEIYLGVPVKIVPSEQEGRRIVKLADVKFVGTTTDNWNEFTETNPGAVNPIKYVKGR